MFPEIILLTMCNLFICRMGHCCTKICALKHIQEKECVRIHNVLGILGLFPVQEVLEIPYERLVVKVAILCQMMDIGRIGEKLYKFKFEQETLLAIIGVLKFVMPRRRGRRMTKQWLGFVTTAGITVGDHFIVRASAPKVKPFGSGGCDGVGRGSAKHRGSSHTGVKP